MPDGFGGIHISRSEAVERPVLPDFFPFDIARSLTVFEDGSRMVLDSFGGRHIEQHRPAFHRLQPIPLWLYLPFEIFWDFEPIPND